MSDYKQSDIKEMTRLLEMRKRNNHRTVLLLGSRAGGLFRSEHLYEVLHKFSYRDFSNLPHTQQFSECYTILGRVPFSETDIHTLVRASLQNLTLTGADICLAELVKKGHFDEIISLNIDDILEQSFNANDMKEHKDFEVSILTNNTFHEKSLSYRIVKVFGDFSLRSYTIIRRLAYLDSNQILKSSLQNILTRDLLIIGLDPVWDIDMLRLLPGGAGTIYFVNEEDLSEHELISHILRERKAQYILGGYDNFVRDLYDSLYGGMPINYRVPQNIFNQLSDLSNQMRMLRDENKVILAEIKQIRDEIGAYSLHQDEEQ